MSGFIKDLSQPQSEALNQFKEYLNKKETIVQIKSDIKNKLPTTTTTTTTTNTETEESSSSSSPSSKEEEKHLKIWNINLENDSKERDIILLKFLRAREFKIENSKQMLIDCLIWRKQNQVDDYEKIVNEAFPDYYKNIGTIFKTDKEGRPVMINHYHAINPDVIFKDGVDQFVRWKVQQMEIAIRDTLIPSQWEIEDLIVIHDYKDCSFFRMDPRIKQASNQTIQTLQNNYPEFLARKFFINIPWLMEKLFSIFTVFTSERTKSKFIICSGNYREKLLKYIEADSIAPKLSGFEDNQSPILNIKIKPQKSHSIQLGKLDADKTIEWEFCTNEIDSEIGAKILIEPNNQPTTSNDILYFNNNSNNNNNNNNSPTPSNSNYPFNCFLSIEPREFNSGSIQIEDDSYYTLVFNNHLNKQCDLFYRITIKSKTTHSSTTTSTIETLGN
ncbi:cellular retinaldehyde-binding/triple function domain-containing protein [Dictyostelium discoideum AX4]|uniref:Cellular retinaldehyde-binding/triple function domain-containing protein n=1 Tax=Dictyostelium discoideum TaxID=44689 RepID=Q55CK3_DICDI|nr:cellular retinaldehyde-binding/triple function domain-containing protein [Dictyostelium discoideum AX4]EAL72361.1 cellular retinaldehyde-binding/triple function domain-containing protein [Dictyostelium discoideum AX4]|eukprot:XP_646478.1 cellular retinaldehyde-binding/triple function domain-containing protein [Dictyostelium discoideum AX4]